MLEAFDFDIVPEPPVVTPPAAVRAIITWRCRRNCTLDFATLGLEAFWQRVVSLDAPGAGATEFRSELEIRPDGSTDHYSAPPRSGALVLPPGEYHAGQEGRLEFTVPVPWIHPTVDITDRLRFLYRLRLDVRSRPGGDEVYRAPVTVLSPKDGYPQVATLLPTCSGPDLGLQLVVPERNVRVGTPVRGTVELARPARGGIRVSLLWAQVWGHTGMLDEIRKELRNYYSVDRKKFKAIPGRAQPFRLDVPADATPTCIPPDRSLRWFVRAEAPTGIWPLSKAARVEVELNVYNGER